MAEKVAVNDFLSTHLDDDKLAKYISNILNSIINPNYEASREVEENKITEHILLGDVSEGDFSKLIVSNESSNGETKKECRFEKNYVYVDGESQERKRFRIVCIFYGIDNVLILLGYGNKFEKEIAIRLQELWEGNGSFGINFYQDLSSLREKRIGVTKDDAIVFAQNGITPSLSLCCWIDSNQYKDIIRSVLINPRCAVRILEQLESPVIGKEETQSVVLSVINKIISSQQKVEPDSVDVNQASLIDFLNILPRADANFIVASLKDMFIPKSKQTKNVYEGIEFYLQGNSFDKVTVFEPKSPEELVTCNYSRNYYIEGKKYRVICNFKREYYVSIIVGYDEQLKQEMIMDLRPDEDGGVIITISHYPDLSKLREIRKGVTKNDVEFLNGNGFEPTTIVSQLLEPEEVIPLIRSIITDPSEALKYFENLLVNVVGDLSNDGPRLKIVKPNTPGEI